MLYLQQSPKGAGGLLKSLDLNHLTVFTKIVESGNLTRTAHVLGVPKSKVSRILSQLERDLGVQLIHRTTRHLQLTDMGQRFYEKCQGPLAGLEAAAAHLRENTDDIQGRIRLTAAQDLGSTLLPGPIDEFSRRYPKIQFQVILSQESLNLVQESIDIAIRVGELKDSRFKAHKIADVSLILVASPRYLETHAPLATLSDLEKAPCLGFEALKGRGWVFRNGKEKRSFKIEPAVMTNNPEFNLKLALKGRGVALLPDYICRESLQSGSLVHLFKNWKGDRVPVSLVFPYQKQMPVHVRKFADFLLSRLKTDLSS
ncbi:MAG: LysR family transcriptional regulator [Bdellovibrionaceae bacterium]|nr:LysR family transcriptional regulator [Pseudobdellovibrionaceae bacterium]